MKISRQVSVIVPNPELGEAIAELEKYHQAQILDGYAKKTLVYQDLDRQRLKELVRIASAETLLMVKWMYEIAVDENLMNGKGETNAENDA